MTAHPSAHRAERRLIDRHFARRISPRGETRLRAHLPDCESCRVYYERQMAIGALLPGLPKMAERLGTGLGIPDAPRGRAVGRWMLAGGMMAAAACLLLLLGRRDLPPMEQEFAARGAQVAVERPQIEVYRVAANGHSGDPSVWMLPGDELAFAYRNPSGFARLMVFGVGSEGEIYWFHPAWTDDSADPRAVPINPGTGPFELPEAIAHQVRGSRLRIVALFTNEPISVRQVEEAERSGRGAPAGATRVETALEIRR